MVLAILSSLLCIELLLTDGTNSAVSMILSYMKLSFRAIDTHTTVLVLGVGRVIGTKKRLRISMVCASKFTPPPVMAYIR